MTQILYPDHTAAIYHVPELIDDFAAANGMTAALYRLADLKSYLKNNDKSSEIQDLFLRPTSLLMVPTTVNVNFGLLQVSKAMNVATPSTGTDHVDFDDLKKHQVAFFSAPGENAVSVVEYVLSAIPVLVDMAASKDAPISKDDLICDGSSSNRRLSLGIIGYGRIGSRLGAVGQRLGWQVRAYDPPLFHSTGHDLDSVLDSDIISLHVPLVTIGQHPTHGMINQSLLHRSRRSSIWLNASRGQVVAADDFAELCATHIAAIDVFPAEPPQHQFLDAATLVTPHIAGYSWRARFRGVYRVLEDFAATKGLRMPKSMDDYAPFGYDLSSIDFIEAESKALRQNPDSFSKRRNQYPTRSGFRDEIESKKWQDRFHTSENKQRLLYFQRIFEIWNQLHFY